MMFAELVRGSDGVSEGDLENCALGHINYDYIFNRVTAVTMKSTLAVSLAAN